MQLGRERAESSLLAAQMSSAAGWFNWRAGRAPATDERHRQPGPSNKLGPERRASGRRREIPIGPFEVSTPRSTWTIDNESLFVRRPLIGGPPRAQNKTQKRRL